MTNSRSLPLFRLFFEAYGLALRHPQRYKEFLQSTVEDWLKFVAGALHTHGHGRHQARVLATVVLAGFRGFLLDYCATGDRKRVNSAMNLWLQALNSISLSANHARARIHA
jgi:hypothetical protein